MLSEAIARFLIMSGGILYPSFCSYKAIRLQDPFLYTKWTAYWVTFAIFHTFEQIFDQFSHLIPFYLELKIVLIFWMVSPSSAGSSFIYSNYLHNAISYLENDIELLINGANKLGYSFIAKIFSNSYLLAFSFVFRTKNFALQFLRQQLSVSADPPTSNNQNIIYPNNDESTLLTPSNIVPNTQVPNTQVPHTQVPHIQVPHTKVPHTQVNTASSASNIGGGILKRSTIINITAAAKQSLNAKPTNNYKSSDGAQLSNHNQSSEGSKPISLTQKSSGNTSSKSSNTKNAEPKAMSYYERFLKKM